MSLQIFHNFHHRKALLAENFFDSHTLSGADFQRDKSGGSQNTPGIHDQAPDNFESILTRRKCAYGLKVSDLLWQLQPIPHQQCTAGSKQPLSAPKLSGQNL